MLSADATYSTTSVVEPSSLKRSRMSRFDNDDFPRPRFTQAMTFVLSFTQESSSPPTSLPSPLEHPRRGRKAPFLR